VGVIFHAYESCAHTFVYSAVRGYNEFYNQYKRLVMERKRKNFNPLVVVVKDKEIVHILIVPSSCCKL